jgi:hypothetical protein
MYIVIIYGGKRDNVDWARIKLAHSSSEIAAILANNRIPGKYWSWAEIVPEGETFEVYRPEEFDE